MKPMFLSRAAAAPVCSQPSVRKGSAHASFSSNGGVPGVPDTELRADFHIFGKQGEAAGTAAYLCLAGNQALSALDGKRVRECLKQGGSAL